MKMEKFETVEKIISKSDMLVKKFVCFNTSNCDKYLKAWLNVIANCVGYFKV